MNWLKDRLGSRHQLNGVWLSSGSPVAAELAATRFDWALLDMEHGVGAEAEIMRQIQILSPSPCAPLVRVPSSTSAAIQRVLDCGASGVMAPMVEDAEQAADFVRRLLYPPAGTRGLTRSSRAAAYGDSFHDYFRQANGQLCAIVQIETAAAVRRVDAIAATDGVDVIFLGHSDLSLNLGCFEQMDAPAMRDAEDTVLAACVRHGKRAGMLLKTGMSAGCYRRRGFTVMALGGDIGCLKRGFDQLLSDGVQTT